MSGPFLNRTAAGRILAPLLRAFARRDDVLVLALPRGGVPVGVEVARRLHVPLDVLVVRKLGVPGREELAMGAIASGGVELRDAAMIAAFNLHPASVETVVRREREELARRERLYRGNRPMPSLEGKTIILVDDGIATGASMHAALRALKIARPRAVVVAAPVADHEAVDSLRKEASAVVTLVNSPMLGSVGRYYRDFRATTDDEVQTALATCWRESGDYRPALTRS